MQNINAGVINVILNLLLIVIKKYEETEFCDSNKKLREGY